MELKNRIVMAPMGTGYMNKGGTVGDQLTDFYEARAEGGVGLIIVGAIPVAPGPSLGIDGDRFIAGFQRLAARIHQYGVKVCIQLVHMGAVAALYSVSQEAQYVAPSPIPFYPRAPVPKEMTVEEIHDVVGAFGLAARRAKAAGVDGVELHGAPRLPY